MVIEYKNMILASWVLFFVIDNYVLGCTPSLTVSGLSSSTDGICLYDIKSPTVNLSVSVGDDTCLTTIQSVIWQFHAVQSSSGFQIQEGTFQSETIVNGNNYKENFTTQAVYAVVATVNFTLNQLNYSNVLTGYFAVSCSSEESLSSELYDVCRSVQFDLKSLGVLDLWKMPTCSSSVATFPVSVTSKVTETDVRSIHSIEIRCRRNCEPHNYEHTMWLRVVCVDCYSKMNASAWSTAVCTSADTNTCGERIVHSTGTYLKEYFAYEPQIKTQYHAAFVTATFEDGTASNDNFVWTYTLEQQVTTGTCSVLPAAGSALITMFTISCTGFMAGTSTLTYTIYTNTENSYKHALLLYKGTNPGVTSSLGQGQASSNYTVYILVKASTSYSTSGIVTQQVQVLPLGHQSSDPDMLNVVESLIDVRKTGSGSQVDTLLTSGNVAGAVQLLGQISVTLNSGSQTAGETGGNTTSATQVRSAVVETIERVDVSDYSTVDMVVAVLNSATQNTTELTEETQSKASEIYNTLAGTLATVNFTGDEVRATAGDLMTGVASLLNVKTDLGFAEITQNNETDFNNNADLQKVKNSTGQLLNTLESVLSTMLSWQLPGESASVVQSNTLSASINLLPVSELLGASLSTPGGLGTDMPGTTVTFPQSLTGESGSDIGVTLLQLDKNPYTWGIGALDVTLDVMSVQLTSADSPINTTSLPEPVTISIPMPDQFQSSQTNMSIHLKRTGTNITFNPAFSNLLTFNFTVHPNKMTLVAVIVIDSNITSFRLLLSLDGPPKLNDVLTDGFLFPEELHLQTNFKSSTPDAAEKLIFIESPGDLAITYYVGLTLDLEHPETMTVLQEALPNCTEMENATTCTTLTTVPLIIETRSLACLYWDEVEEAWSDVGCQVSSNTTRSDLLCSCTHMTSFSGSVVVLPNFIDPVGDAAMFLTFFDNPVVVTMVILVWVVYFFLIHWARRADRNDLETLGVVNCPGNDVSHKNRYLICVVTGWRGDAGTTANVCIYIKGSHGCSPRRRLGTSARRCFQTGYEDWILFTCDNYLGNLREVTLWHDNAGTSPHWYLSHVYIKDLSTEQHWTFIYNDWLAVDRGSIQMTSAIISAIPANELASQARHNFFARSTHDLRDGHLWISVFSKPARSTFTRVQRLTCALSLLLLTMLTNIMFYGIPTEDPEDQLQVGGSVFSLSALIIGIESSLLMFPVNLIILQLFLKVKSRPARQGEEVIIQLDNALKNTSTSRTAPGLLIIKGLFKMMDIPVLTAPCNQELKTADLEDTSEGDTVIQTSHTSKIVLASDSKNTGKFLPWWFVYIAWVLVLLTCVVSSYFVMLYGLKYGYTRSLEWLISFITCFTNSAFITQPIKVFVIALVLTWIFKKSYDIGEMGPDIYIDEDDEMMKKVSGQPDVHVPYNTPLSARIIQTIRQRLKLEWLMKLTLRDIVLYMVYLTVVLVVVHGHRNIQQAYRNTLAIEDILVNPGCINLNKCFFLAKVDTPEKVLMYLKTVLVPSLEDMSHPDHTYATPGSSHFLVGPYRLRQVRVKHDSCSEDVSGRISMLFDRGVPDCKGEYWLGAEDNQDYNGSWSQVLGEPGLPQSIWSHMSSWELWTMPFAGKFATYSGGGYVLNMPSSSNQQMDILSALWNSDWLDRRSRAVFVEFTLFNPNVKIFSVVSIIFEFTNKGVVFPSHEVLTAQLYRPSTSFDQFITTCECLFILFNMAYIYIEYTKYKKLGRHEYLSDFWNWIEIVQISLAISVIGLYFKRLLTVDDIIKKYQESSGQTFVSFYTALSWDFILRYVMAFLVGLLILKFIKLLRFNKNIFKVADTLSHSRESLISFMVMVLLFGIAFAHFTVLAFGTNLYDYRNILASFLTLFNFSLGVSDLPGLQSASRVLGPAYFVVFVFLIQFCFLTVFAAILNFAINDAKELFEQRKNKFELLDYIKCKVKEVIRF